MARFAVILAAAGRSTRFSKQRRKKPFVELKGRAVWLRAADIFLNRDDVCQTIIAVSPDDIDWFKEKFGPNLAFLDIQIVPGGAERADTVQNALNEVTSEADFIAVHDAARPLIVSEWVDAVFRAAEDSGAAIPAVPVASTLKRVDGEAVTETVSRESLWQAQTPQVFRREILMEAYAQRGEFQPTDEAQLVERAGHSVKIVKCSPMNFKITTEDDFRMAEVVLDALPKPKTFRSLHPFADEMELQ